MKLRDYEGLNDIECWHADHFAERLHFWRGRNVGDATCFRLARIDAQKRFPLEPEEVPRMDEYVATRFGTPRVERRPEGTPAPAFVVN